MVKQMATAEKVLNVARSQLGVKENPPNSNNILYNTAYFGHVVSGKDYAWCMTFIWWVFKTAGASALFYGGGKTASCTAFMNWAKKTGRWVTSDFKPGDIVTFNFDSDPAAEHCGIIERDFVSSISTIEGNTSMYGSQDNGGEVCRKMRSKKLILGAYRPAYEATSARKGGFDLSKLNELRKGAKGDTIRALQILLNGYGYKCGTVDGDFGEKTALAVKAFQKANGLAVDGIVGEMTWSKLLGI